MQLSAQLRNKIKKTKKKCKESILINLFNPVGKYLNLYCPSQLIENLYQHPASLKY